MLKKIFVFILILLSLASCDKKIDQLEFEKQVAYEIFPQLLDSLHEDTRLNIAPIISKYKKVDTLSGEWFFDKEKVLEEIERRKQILYKDSVKLITAISDSTYLLKKRNASLLLKHFNSNRLTPDTTNLDFKYQIDLDKLKADEKIDFKYASNFPRFREFWTTDYDFYMNAIFSMSRIRFDSSFSYGVLKCGYGTGYLNSGGYRVYIKKVQGRWIIDEMDLISRS
ncbi:hypothetical protein C8P64_2004 [Christiangramia gaetbulicola]|uniref:Uncharacterized protein n=1 Tax=Christiangramia gaetbulicola TaxID=703340 RepID=A0A2T6AI36_9FLAO|nr:hypothetical protein [Christiangramia gaetbulicola]PTX43476.1 hypothetical protein C8P64_2004 [Christiangramia gaetbulicola]